MKTSRRHRVVLVTAPNLRIARRVARALLEARVAACVNLVRGVESHYWWEGKLESGGEVLLVCKTTSNRLARLGAVLRSVHPYDTPECIALPIVAGSQRYLDWVDATCAVEAP